jgi:hypothetical protein
MEPIPFKIPKSLTSYVEQFDDNPEKVITKLHRQVKKRGYDAVGHFLLAWFYHQTEQNDDALRHALIAKTYAPGSPLMEHLHYFLLHPEKFHASIPKQPKKGKANKHWSAKTSPKLYLDKLIEMLSEVESKKIMIPDKDDPNAEDLSKASVATDDIATETIARIHEKQGKIKEAIATYETLIRRKPENRESYEERIRELKEEKSG